MSPRSTKTTPKSDLPSDGAEQPELPAETEFIAADGIRLVPLPDPETDDPRITPEQVAQSMTLLPIGDVRPHPDNNNVGAAAAIGESINELGFFDPIIVQKSTGYVISGNHRWAELQARGATHVPALVYDVDDLTAKRMMLAVNRTARLGHDDAQATYNLLRALEEEAGTPYVLCGTGFSTDDYAELMAKFDAPEPDAAPVPSELAADPEPEPDQAEPDDTEPEDAPLPLAAERPAERPEPAPARAGTGSGMREVIVVLPLADHADLMADIGALRKAMPGDYSTGALFAAAVHDLRVRVVDLAPAGDLDMDCEPLPVNYNHSETCPCFHCNPPEPLAEAMIPRPARPRDDDQEADEPDEEQ